MLFLFCVVYTTMRFMFGLALLFVYVFLLSFQEFAYGAHFAYVCKSIHVDRFAHVGIFAYTQIFAHICKSVHVKAPLRW